MRAIIDRWGRTGGYYDVLKIAFPLILSTGAIAVQHFVDRMFLAWYSQEAIAASTPAGILNFMFMSFFIGLASYVSTFVAQYDGAKQYEKVGKVVWQGLYFSVIAALCMFLLIPLSEPMFRMAGHSAAIQKLENQYFVILCAGAFFPIAASALSGFFSGIEATWTVLWVNLAMTATNVILDYLLIFGYFGMPELGIVGAGIATNIAGGISFSLFFLLMFQKQYLLKFKVWKGRQFDFSLFRRLWYYGSPSGVQFFLEMVGFTLFILLVGRYGQAELTATNIAFNINTFAFMPMVGCGIAVSVMVGQHLGDKNPKTAEYATWSAAHLSFFYMTLFAIAYTVFPGLFLRPFGYQEDPAVFKQVYEYGVVLLRFIAIYSIFDTLTIIFASAIKGAGDTKFVMYIMVIASWTLMVIPTYCAVEIFHWDLFSAWAFASLYIILVGFIFLLRFRQGKWKKMLVIEPTL